VVFCWLALVLVQSCDLYGSHSCLCGGKTNGRIRHGLTLICVDISSLSKSPTLDGKVDVEHNISERTHKPNVLRF
jgi:hypothetical protein